MFYDEGIIINCLSEKIKNLEREIDKKNKEIAHANFVNGIFRHEINNHQLAVSAYICLLDEAQDEQEKADMVEKLSVSSKKINSLIRDWFKYQKAGYKLEWRTISNIFERSYGLHSNIKINIIKDDILIFCTPATPIMMSSMVNNTAMHGGKDVNSINVWWEKVPEGIIFVYEDNGVGVPDDEKGDISEKGIGKNNGLGLYLVKEILKLSKCKIIENGIYGKGARFEVSIPDGLYKLY
jgi:signal transduction histidine kinase